MTTSDLLAALNIVGLESEAESAFRPIGPVAAAFSARFPALASERVDPAHEFPFLATFLEDAAGFWREGAGAVLKSGVWSQPDATGDSCELEATAICSHERRILLLEFLGPEHAELQDILQSAREQKLAYDQLEKLQAALRRSAKRLRTVAEERQEALRLLQRSRDQLEQRVADRTAELVATNELLRREITERRKANEMLLSYQRELRSLAHQLTTAEARERRQIATDLHDSIGQTLALVRIKLGLLGKEVGGVAGDEVAQIRGLVEQLIVHTRSLTFELGSPALYELGLESALSSLIERFEETHGIAARFEDDGKPKTVDTDLRLVLYQSVRELLHNVVKHADAEQVTVSTSRDGDQIAVVVADDGRGLSTDHRQSCVAAAGGFGLFNIRERIDHLGGSCEIETAPGAGTRVVLRAPVTTT